MLAADVRLAAHGGEHPGDLLMVAGVVLAVVGRDGFRRHLGGIDALRSCQRVRCTDGQARLVARQFLHGELA